MVDELLRQNYNGHIKLCSFFALLFAHWSCTGAFSKKHLEFSIVLWIIPFLSMYALVCLVLLVKCVVSCWRCFCWLFKPHSFLQKTIMQSSCLYSILSISMIIIMCDYDFTALRIIVCVCACILCSHSDGISIGFNATRYHWMTSILPFSYTIKISGSTLGHATNSQLCHCLCAFVWLFMDIPKLYKHFHI